MKKLILILSIIFTSNTALSQNKDSLDILRHNKWIPYLQNRWLDKDTLALKSLKKMRLDNAESLKKGGIILPKEDLDIVWDETDYRDVISFDSIQNVIHVIRISCPVGETIYHISKFRYENNQITIDYNKRPWAGEIQKKKNSYSIIRWNEHYIVLKKQ